MDDQLYEEFYRIESTHWWAVGMRGIFRMLLESALRDKKPRILDVGCGTGIALQEFQCYGSVCGLDRAWPAVSYSKLRVPGSGIVQGSLAHLPIADGGFDLVLAFDVIEHLEDDKIGLREILRVLRPGGLVLLNVPAFQSLWSEKDTINHHFRRYSRASLQRAVVQSGFGVERLTYTNATLFPLIWSVRQIQRMAHMSWNPHAEYHPKPWINQPLKALLGLERTVLRHIDLPFGTSVSCVARKPD